MHRPGIHLINNRKHTDPSLTHLIASTTGVCRSLEGTDSTCSLNAGGIGFLKNSEHRVGKLPNTDAETWKHCSFVPVGVQQGSPEWQETTLEAWGWSNNKGATRSGCIRLTWRHIHSQLEPRDSSVVTCSSLAINRGTLRVQAVKPSAFGGKQH